jgi:putative spermidine/putrescine transport system ATP-binding protein
MGEQAALVVRPEKLLLCKNDDGFLSGRVEESIYAGSETRLLVRLPSDTVLTVRRDAGLPPVAIGENVFLRWDRQQARLLEGGSAAAIT